MPDVRKHRGPHPEDAKLFASAALPALTTATRDLCWLLTRGYADKSSLKLVGDRHGLTQRQRVAVWRCATSDQQKADRDRRRLLPSSLRGAALHVDGFNVLTTLEAALSGGVILRARDGCDRDMASMHGNYRKVTETVPAIRLAGGWLAEQGVAEVVWLLDRPVANSGRLRQVMAEIAAEEGWPWRIELDADPDSVLVQSKAVVASADRVVLDGPVSWVNLARHLVEAGVDDAWVVDLSGTADKDDA